ncbi:MAG: hypothetical protein D8H97_32445, partial [Neisseria sp.]
MHRVGYRVDFSPPFPPIPPYGTETDSDGILFSLSDLSLIASLLRFGGKMGRNTDSFAAGVGGGAESDGGSRGKT